MKRILSLIICLLLIFALTTYATAEAKKGTITMSSGSLGGTWFGFGAFLGARIFEPLGFEFINKPGGGIANIIATNEGISDIGLAHTVGLALAIKGEEPFEKPMENVVGLMAFFAEPIHLVVLEGIGISKLPDLIGQKFGGALRSHTADVFLRDAFEIYGINNEEQINMQYGSPAELVDLLKDKHIAGFGYGLSVPAAPITELCFTQKIKFLSFDEEELNKLFNKREGYSKYIIPSGTYPKQNYDVQTFAGRSILVISADVPEDIVYEMTKALVEKFDTLGEGLAGLEKAKLEETTEFGGLPVHKGAIKYYKEAGLWKD